LSSNIGVCMCHVFSIWIIIVITNIQYKHIDIHIYKLFDYYNMFAILTQCVK